jgi:hypothetical protein
MLEQRIKLKNSMKNNEPKYKVRDYFRQYEEAFKRLHKPSESNWKEYINLRFDYFDYMNTIQIRGKKK